MRVLELARRERVDVPSLQELTPGSARAFDRARASRLYPHQALEPGERAAGSGLLSRRPLDGAGSPRTTIMRWPQVRVNVGGPDLLIRAIHVAPPPRRHRQWSRELRGLPRTGDSDTGALRILIGDFSATLDHAAFRDLVARGYDDAADTAGAGLRGTYRGRGSLFPPVAIDHVLVDERIRVVDVKVHPFGSDHRAVVATARVPSA